jgi:hypothetical protein
MIQDINKHLELIESSLAWAKEFGKDSFPVSVFKEYRRKLRRIRSALEENCSAAAYGESQVGKSYLMSSLLSSADSPFVIQSGGRSYSFIDELNPSGGNNAKIESTGVITRFTIGKGDKSMSDFVKVRLLSVVDIILLIADSYYNDIKINPDTNLNLNEINKCLEGLSGLWATKEKQQDEIIDDDIRDIKDYIKNVIGNGAASIYQSNFCKIIAPVIQYVSYDKWVDIFSLLWNKNAEMSRLFSVLINEYKKLGFNTEVYVPFDAVLRDKGTILKIEWLDTVCGVNIDTGNDDIYTDVYDTSGNIIAQNFGKGNLSALIAELTFELPKTIAQERKFLNKIDLLDFPGARSREKFKESEIHTVLPKILRRGKVAYLFNKYSRSLRISSVLFCHHNDQKTEPTIGETINSWIGDNIGKTPEERAKYLLNTNGIAPLFMIATKFNIDLERTKTDNVDNLKKLDDHWNRFDTVIPEIIKPNKWFDEWVPKGGFFTSSAFQNVYPLRDFYWSGKNNLFVGYQDGEKKSEETGIFVHQDFPDYMEHLRRSFLQNDFVKTHFSNPEDTWNNVATINNDGSKAIIRSLDSIANLLDDARRQKYLSELQTIKKEMYQTLTVYFEPEDSEEKNRKVKQICGDIRKSLVFTIGTKPEIFGRIIDSLMVPVGDLRDIAYDIIICHSETPKDFSAINFIRATVGINPKDGRDVNLNKLCDYFSSDVDELEKDLKERGCTIEEVISSDAETLTTVADVVTKHIIDYWVAFLNNQAKEIENILPHADEVVFMLVSLLKKLGVRKVISEKIDRYCNVFSLNEQPNAIADFASLTLNNFVSSVGRNYISNDEIADISAKAQKCHLTIDTAPDTWDAVRKPQPLLQTLKAFDESANVVNQDVINMDVLLKLPLWGNFQRWQNLVTIGLVYASDISHCDPVANAKIREIMDNCQNLYK